MFWDGARFLSGWEITSSSGSLASCHVWIGRSVWFQADTQIERRESEGFYIYHICSSLGMMGMTVQCSFFCGHSLKPTEGCAIHFLFASILYFLCGACATDMKVAMDILDQRDERLGHFSTACKVQFHDCTNVVITMAMRTKRNSYEASISIIYPCVLTSSATA